MLFHLHSEAFDFLDSKAQAVPNWPQPFGHEDQMLIGSLRMNQIDLPGLKQQGTYAIWAGRPQIKMLSTGLLETVTQLIPWVTVVSPEDVHTGEKVLHVPQSEIFLVRFYRGEQRLRNHKVLIFADPITSGVSSDEKGDLVLLDDPVGLFFVPEEGVDIRIQKLR